jgi:hypothetical protein
MARLYCWWLAHGYCIIKWLIRRWKW